MKTNRLTLIRGWAAALLLAVALLLPQAAAAYDFMVGDLCYNKNSDGTSVSVTYQTTSSPRYTDLSGDLVIPSTITYSGTTYSVTSIGSDAFYKCSALTSVTIPNSVTSIGGSAFYGCISLTGELTIPSSVTSIGGSAFSGCSGLTSVTIGNSVTSIGGSAFSGCSGLTSVTWNAKNCSNFTSSTTPFSSVKTSIKNFTFGDEVEKIPDYLCYQMTGLTSVTIPNSVTSIGSDAFEDCSGLTSVTIGNSVTSIGYSAFRDCSGLTSVTWNAKSCADISSSSPFSSAKTSIKSFTFGDEVEKIPAYLCYKMAGLTSVIIPNSVTSIGGSAFSGCSGLTSVTIPNSVTSISSEAFRDCSGLTSVTIGNSVTSIGNSAFNGCSGLKSLVIGKSVSEFTSVSQYSYQYGQNVDNSYTFYDCKSLSKITSYAQVPGKFKGREGFGNVPTSCILYVPKGTVEAYRNASPWSRFTNILEMESLVATAGEVTVSRPGELVEVPITLTMPDGCTLNDITIDLTYPDGLLPLADEQGRYGAAGDGINVVNGGAPVMTFVDNFSSDDVWPDYQVTGDAALAVQANAGNPTAVYSLHVTGDPFYTAGDRDLKVHVRYTDIDGDEYEAGTAEEFELLTTVHFVRDYDINGDGIVDINDVSIMINLIMGRTTSFAGRADLTGDGRISVSDLNMVIDAMLGKY